MFLMVPRKNCIVCEKEIFRCPNKHSKRQRRGNKDITCSHKCSVIYNRIASYVRLRKNK